MNFEIFDLRAILFGVLAGLICVGGLSFGMGAILNSTRDDLGLSDGARRRQKGLGIAIVLGQFFGAFGVLWYFMSSTPKPAVLPLAFGLVISIFAGNAVFSAMRK